VTEQISSDCVVCAQEHAAAADIVVAGPRWGASVFPGYEVPGWVVLRLRRHVPTLRELSTAQARDFGEQARRLAAAIEHVTGAPRTYLMIFGEAHAHFHALLAPRTDDVAPEFRGARILDLRTRSADLDRSRALAAQIRAAHEAMFRTAPAAPTTFDVESKEPE
jgi:diadenosine tetraphosphate (Ap4A) HIT family hydrolase